ncbi:MAG: STAS domain-containing protein, partial [Methylococcales bacterium]
MLRGDWTTAHLIEIEAQLQALNISNAGTMSFEATGIDSMDTGGAWIFCRLLKGFEDRGISIQINGLREEFRRLVDLIATREESPAPTVRLKDGLLAHWGRVAVQFVEQAFLMVT